MAGLRRRVLAAGAALMLVMTAACGLRQQEGGRSNLAVWHEFAGSGNKAVDELVAGFNEKYPDLTFKTRQIADSEVNTVLRTGLAGNNPPAIAQYEGYQQTADYAKAGQLTDITSWWNKHKDAFAFADNQGVKDACEYKGKMYCIPWGMQSSNQLFYNPTLLKKYGLSLPKKPSDLAAAARKLKGTGVSAISLYSSEGWPAGHWWYLFSVQRCGIDKVLAAAKQRGAQWDDPCFTRAAKDLYDLGKAGAFPKGVAGSDYNAQMSLFLSGKAVFMNTGTWFYQTMAENPPSIKVDVAPFPQVDPAHPSAQIVGGLTEVFGIPAHAGDKKAAYKFLDYMAQKSSGELFAKASVLSMVDGADDQLPSGMKPSWKTVETALDRPGNNIVSYFENLVPPSVGENTMYNGVTTVAAGTSTPREFTTKLQTAAAAAK